MEEAPAHATDEWSVSYVFRDVVVFISVMVVPLLWRRSNSDWIDGIALMVLVLGVALVRLVLRRKPLSNEQLAYYFAFWFTTLDALDKFGGYGKGGDWEIESFGAGVLVSCYLIFHVHSSRRLVAAAPLLLFFVPLTQAPLDLARNLIARSDGGPVDGTFVTKIVEDGTYGVFFDRPTKVRFIMRTEQSEMLVYDTDTTGLGSGSMPPQYSRASDWQRKLVRMMVME